jgi:hypothetical protein
MKTITVNVWTLTADGNYGDNPYFKNGVQKLGVHMSQELVHMQ